MQKRAKAGNAAKLRASLVRLALEWQKAFGVAPHITNAISELDAALLVGMTENQYCLDCAGRTAVTRGRDFTHRGCAYQVKANRPSGRPGSKARFIRKAKNYDWDKLIWILYDRYYCLQEAWEWKVRDYKQRFKRVKYLRPEHMRKGRRLFPK
jgi:hypothetical protein